MESTTTTAGAIPAGGPGGPGGVMGDSHPHKIRTDEQQRWRLKYYRQRAARGRSVPLPPDLQEWLARNPAPSEPGRPPESAPAGDHGAPAGSPVAPVAWSADLLRPLVRSLVPSVEGVTIARLKGKALPLGDQGMIDLVEKEGAWPGPAKETIIATLPELACQALDSAGIDPKFAPAIALGGALTAIATSHLMLAAKLDALARDVIAKRREAASTVSAGPPSP